MIGPPSASGKKTLSGLVTVTSRPATCEDLGAWRHGPEDTAACRDRLAARLGRRVGSASRWTVPRALDTPGTLTTRVVQVPGGSVSRRGSVPETGGAAGWRRTSGRSASRTSSGCARSSTTATWRSTRSRGSGCGASASWWIGSSRNYPERRPPARETSTSPRARILGEEEAVGRWPEPGGGARVGHRRPVHRRRRGSGTRTGRSWHVVAILDFRGDRIARSTEYFAPVFEAPAWRAAWVERYEPG